MKRFFLCALFCISSSQAFATKPLEIIQKFLIPLITKTQPPYFFPQKKITKPNDVFMSYVGSRIDSM